MIAVLTGAGISRESGLETFRDEGGLWSRHRIEDVATPAGFRRNPALVYGFYDQRRAGLQKVRPNAAHLALAALAASGRRMALITQNVDDLHERAGSPGVIHMHGELLAALCLECGRSMRWTASLGPADRCPECGGGLRPDVVWFGETPYRLDEIAEAVKGCSTFVSIGTSGTVHPAAGLVRLAKGAGAEAIELNLEPSANRSLFDRGFYGPATEVVPAWVDSVLGR
jgi:NAD-dependent deacetylase